MVREAELTGVVKPETDDRALDRTASKMEQRFQKAATLVPEVDTSSLRRKLEAAIPGGGLLGGAVDRLTGRGGAAAGGGAGGQGALGDEKLKIQTAQLEKLDEILETMEKSAVSGGGGGGGLGSMIPGGAGGGGLLGGVLGGSAAGTLGGASLGTLGLGAAGVAGIGVGGWALNDIASGGKGFKEIGDLGEKFQEQFPDLGSGIKDLFTENPIHDLGEDIGSGDFSWPEMPSLDSLSWPSLPDLSNLPWPDLPSLKNLSWPSLPDLSNLPWPDLPSLKNLSWPSLPSLKDLSWPEMPSFSWPDVPKPIQQFIDEMEPEGEGYTSTSGPSAGNSTHSGAEPAPGDGTDIESDTVGGRDELTDRMSEITNVEPSGTGGSSNQTQQPTQNRARGREVVIPVEDNRTIEVNANLRLDNVREQLRREGIDPDVIEEVARKWPEVQRNMGNR